MVGDNPIAARRTSHDDHPPMKIDLVTVFPDTCESWLDSSIIGRARKRGLMDITAVDPRAWAGGRHRKVDDRPFGGGPGMVMMAPPIAGCLDHLMAQSVKPRLLMTSPQGRKLDQPRVRELAQESHLIVLCGHYEGIDERIVELYQPELFSIGDLVISGGELAALVLVDAVTRLQPGALGNAESAVADSFTAGDEFDHPSYTRPREFRDLEVPEALMSGDHAAIAKWREQERKRRSSGTH
jgi:tRNA (guanine37-N1)-methyltransferase